MCFRRPKLFAPTDGRCDRHLLCMSALPDRLLHLDNQPISRLSSRDLLLDGGTALIKLFFPFPYDFCLYFAYEFFNKILVLRENLTRHIE